MNPATQDLRNVLDCEHPGSYIQHSEAIEYAAPLLDAILVALANAACSRSDSESHLPADPQSSIALAMLGRDLLACSARHAQWLFEIARGDHRPARRVGDDRDPCVVGGFR